MTLIELLYFIVSSNVAFYAARWVYFRGGWIWAIVAFAFLWGPCLWFFFSGRFGRLLEFLARRSKSKDRD
jgi:hypothetical protein